MQRNEANHRLSNWLKVTHRTCNWAKYWIFICGFVFQHFTIRSSFKFSFKWEEKKAEEFQTFSSYQSFTYFQAWENNLWKTIQIGRHIFRNWYLMSKLWLAWQMHPCCKYLIQTFTFQSQVLTSVHSWGGVALSHCLSASICCTSIPFWAEKSKPVVNAWVWKLTNRELK